MCRLFFIATLLLSGMALGQSKSAGFTLDEINGEVHLEITIYTGNICNGIKIYRSADSLNYEVIGDITGYCGSVNETLSYDYTDEDPITNQLSYYKVELVGLEITAAQSIQVIDLYGKKYKVWPNPVNDTATVYFNNKLKEELFFSMYDLQGKLAYSTSTTTSSVQLNTLLLENGTYIFRISSKQGERVAAGKLLIAH